MANYTGINHLAMVTRDMRVTIRFWREQFSGTNPTNTMNPTNSTSLEQDAGIDDTESRFMQYHRVQVHLVNIRIGLH